MSSGTLPTDPPDNLRLRDLILPGLIFTALIMLPYLIAWLATPAGMRFSGALANHNDFSSYIAAMRQGAEGKWLFHFNFSPEPWQPKLMLPLYMLTGRLAGLVGGSHVLWFHLLRLAAIVTTLLGLRFWLVTVFPGRRRTQLTALIFILFGGGISWLLFPLLAASNPGFTYFPDLSGSEWTATLIGLNAPHYLFGLGLQAGVFGALWRMARAESNRSALKWAAGCLAAALALGLVYVYQTAVIGAVTGVYLLALALQERRIPWRTWLLGGLVLVPLVPLLFYYGVWVNRDPAWAEYVVSPVNHIPATPLPGMAIGMGVLAVLVLPGLVHWLRTGRDWLLPVWLVVNLLLMYIPIVQYSGRFTLGLIIPVGTMAAYGLEAVLLPWWRARDDRPDAGRFLTWLTGLLPADSWRRITILLTLPSALMVSLFLVQDVLTHPDFPHYLPQTDIAAAEWLAENSTADDLVLAAYPMGHYLPAIAPARQFLSQFFLTLQFEDKLADVQRFWAADTSNEWRQALVDEWDITYIFAGTYEQRMAGEAIEVPGRVVYQNENVTIYTVRFSRPPSPVK